MQGPAIDLVLLALLILFFGTLQRGRPQPIYRFWFAGWILVFLSYALREVRFAHPVAQRLQDAAGFDLLLAGVLTFLMSFLATEKRLRRTVLLGLFIGIPAVLVFDIQQGSKVPAAGLILAVVLWQGYGVYAVRRLLPRAWMGRRLLLSTICIGYGAALVTQIGRGANFDLAQWILSQVLLCAAVLYGVEHGRRSLVGGIGTLGFVAWAVLYVLDPAWLRPSGPWHVLSQFSDIPPRLVAFSMIVRIFEGAIAETAHLAAGYRELYDDFRLLYERNPHPMWIYGEGTSRFLSANRAAVRAYGYSERELLQMDVMDLLAEPEPGHATSVKSSSEVLGEPVRLHHRMKDKRVIAADVTEHRILFQGEPARFVMAVDVTELERESRDLLHRANHDALTGLANRHELDDRIDACLDRSVRDRRKAVLLTIDVDYFKQVNDTHGHLVGDECLKAVAARLQSRIRQVDTLARTGGEEFTAIIGGLSSADDAPKIAATLLGIFAAPMMLAGGEIQLSISIGAAIFPDDGTDRQTLLLRSDEALYEAKRQGRNRVEFAPKPAVQVDLEPVRAK
jgi:diguanylate cyclase (GGDEF)-like protein/PAS domain S-box-containing protein